MNARLSLPLGMTAIIGSGGKTTLLLSLARQLPGRRLICTSTKIYPPEGFPVFSGNDTSEIDKALTSCGAVCVGAPIELGKLGAPRCSFSALLGLCDYLLVEADGSHGLPLKAHLPNEPVLPPERTFTVLVAGLSGIGKPIAQAAHRPERFSELCAKPVTAPVAPEDLAAVLASEHLADMVILNQADTGNYDLAARKIARSLPCPVYVGSIAQGKLHRL